MGKRAILHTVFMAGTLLLLAGLTTTDVRAAAIIQETTVVDLADLVTERGTATLVRTRSGVTIDLTTSGLEPGTVITLWWVLWNNPDGCVRDTTFFCNDVQDLITGQADFIGPGAHGIVDEDGGLTIAGHIKEGDIEGSLLPLFELEPIGFVGEAQEIEVHFLLRRHPSVSELTPGQVDDALHSFTGGCAVGSGCEDLQAGIFLPPQSAPPARRGHLRMASSLSTGTSIGDARTAWRKRVGIERLLSVQTGLFWGREPTESHRV
jgi:hypothetical protein